jgi:hypothetical protein
MKSDSIRSARCKSSPMFPVGLKPLQTQSHVKTAEAHRGPRRRQHRTGQVFCGKQVGWALLARTLLTGSVTLSKALASREVRFHSAPGIPCGLLCSVFVSK